MPQRQHNICFFWFFFKKSNSHLIKFFHSQTFLHEVVLTELTLISHHGHLLDHLLLLGLDDG